MNAPKELKLDIVEKRYLVGNRFAEVSSVYGIRWGTLVGLKKTGYNEFIEIRLDGTTEDGSENEIFLKETVIMDFDFTAVLNFARLQYQRREYDYEQAAREQRSVSALNRGYTTSKESY